jgi:hypothetical protein
MLVEETDKVDKYLCAPASLSRIEALTRGELDLRAVYEVPEVEELYVVEAISGELKELSSAAIDTKAIPDSWFPIAGCYLTEEKPGDALVKEAMERQRVVIHYRLNPPEASKEPKITAEHLGQAVKLVQRLVKYAYGKAVRIKDEFRDKTMPAPYQLEVTSFSPGSFTIHMQSALTADLLGYVQISRALEIIDAVSERIDAPKEAVDKVAEFGGHFASAYKNLLQFITDTETPVEYTWSTPEQKPPRHYRINTKQAKPVYEEITKRTEIETEEARLVGRLSKVDEKYRTWRIVTEENQKEYGGSSDIDLAGLTIGTRRYEFVCEERLEEERGTGREKTTLHLKSFKEL